MENFSATGRGLASAEAVFAQSFKFFGLICTFGHVKKVYHEAPRANTRGIFSPLLRRERNPSEAEISSHSSTGLRPRFSAKGDKQLILDDCGQLV